MRKTPEQIEFSVMVLFGILVIAMLLGIGTLLYMSCSQ